MDNFLLPEEFDDMSLDEILDYLLGEDLPDDRMSDPDDTRPHPDGE